MILDEILSDTIAEHRSLVISPDVIKILNTEMSNLKKYKPICKYNVAYIVGIILINNEDEVCLIQEAKKTCEGKWYYPAGRMEKNEDLFMAAKRECEEETGYVIEPISLCAVEVDSYGKWYRFTFIALIIGGCLKTTEKADSESLQANWFKIEPLKDEKNWNMLRSIDFLKLLDLGLIYYKNLEINSLSIRPFHSSGFIMPLSIPQEFNMFTYVILNETASSYLVFEEGQKDFLPSAIIISCDKDQHSVEYGLESLIFPKCFSKKDFTYKLHGALTLYYDGRVNEGEEIKLHDGLQIVFLVTIVFKDSAVEEKTAESFKWRQFKNNDFVMKIKENLNNDHSFIKVLMI
jgi:8-oxo-dGDP phosphatase